MCVCVYVCMCICVCVCIFTHTQPHTYIYIYADIDITTAGNPNLDWPCHRFYNSLRALAQLEKTPWELGLFLSIYLLNVFYSLVDHWSTTDIKLQHGIFMRILSGTCCGDWPRCFVASQTLVPPNRSRYVPKLLIFWVKHGTAHTLVYYSIWFVAQSSQLFGVTWCYNLGIGVLISLLPYAFWSSSNDPTTASPSGGERGNHSVNGSFRCRIWRHCP
jgi:hypothetical protein